jgi:hypothetical protein
MKGNDEFHESNGLQKKTRPNTLASEIDYMAKESYKGKTVNVFKNKFINKQREIANPEKLGNHIDSSQTSCIGLRGISLISTAFKDESKNPSYQRTVLFSVAPIIIIYSI